MIAFCSGVKFEQAANALSASSRASASTLTVRVVLSIESRAVDTGD
jgi:hypothetical protein